MGQIRASHANKIIILVFCFIFSFAIAPTPARSETRESLTVSPLRNELKVIPTQKYEGSIKLENSGELGLDLELYASDFSVIDEAYNQIFSSTGKSLSSSNWYKFSQNNIHLPAKSKQVIKYNIDVPDNAEPGGHYSAIFAQTKNNNQQKSDVVEIKRVASLTYIEVAGDIVRIGKIDSLKTNFWQNKPSVMSQLRLRNEGNSHYRVDGYVKLKNLYGKELNSSRVNGLLLPQTTRLFNISSHAPIWPGIYKLEANFVFLDGVSQSKSNWFVYLPTVYIYAIGLVLICLILSIAWRQIHKRKS